MRIIFPLVPTEFEITAQKKTQPFRFGVRSLMIAVAAIAIVVDLLLPLSAADQRRMSIYEQLGNTEPKGNSTSAHVITQIGCNPIRKADLPNLISTSPVPGFGIVLRMCLRQLYMSLYGPTGRNLN